MRPVSAMSLEYCQLSLLMERRVKGNLKDSPRDGLGETKRDHSVLEDLLGLLKLEERLEIDVPRDKVGVDEGGGGAETLLFID